MTPQQQAEVAFWRALHAEKGTSYYAYRTGEIHEKTRHYTLWPPAGRGIEVGCGLVSVYDASPLDILCLDPLLDEYDQIIPSINLAKPYARRDAEDSVPGTNDYIICQNMLDHTPHPDRVLANISDALDPDGLLYLEVNFDDALSGPHYMLWDQEVLDRHMTAFHCLYHVLERVPEHHQSRYWGEYARR
jgi:SAM-dependent methyltransferase